MKRFSWVVEHDDEPIPYYWRVSKDGNEMDWGFSSFKLTAYAKVWYVIFMEYFFREYV